MTKRAFRGHPPHELTHQQAEPAEQFELVVAPYPIERDHRQGGDQAVTIVDGGHDRLPVGETVGLAVLGAEQLVERHEGVPMARVESRLRRAWHRGDEPVFGDAVSDDDPVGLGVGVVLEDTARHCADDRTDLDQGRVESLLRLTRIGVDQGGADGPQHLLRRTDPAHFGHRRPIGRPRQTLSERTATLRVVTRLAARARSNCQRVGPAASRGMLEP